MGIVVGEDAVAFEKLSKEKQDANVKDYIESVYATMSGEDEDFDVNTFVLNIYSTSWSKDPLTYGAYSYRPPGTHHSEAYTLAYPVQSVWFAGEATSPTMYGYVHGAWIAGANTAAKVTECLSDPAKCPQPVHDIPTSANCSYAYGIEFGVSGILTSGAMSQHSWVHGALTIIAAATTGVLSIKCT